MTMHRPTRRSAFPSEAAERPMPSKELPPDRSRIRPSVERAVAEMAAHLTQNPLFVELVGIIRQESMDKLMASPLGAEGTAARELARYELEALKTIEARLTSIASEMSLHGGYDETADEASR
jgi:hypothetical protein